MAITVYSKPNCVQCNATYRALDKAGLRYETVDISLDVEALEQVRALGYTVPFAFLAITYLASNTVGSIVPSPGGIGPVELALTAGLVAAGVPYGVALSTAIVYRLVTFWIPIPVGWLSLQRLQKVGDL